MINDNSDKISDIFINISRQCMVMVKIVKKIDKIRKQELKNIMKDTDKSKASINIKKPISNNLLDFMELEKNTLISKSEALKYISKYINNHNLQVNENKKKFMNDINLSKLFNVETNSILTYMDINGKLSPHFSK